MSVPALESYMLSNPGRSAQVLVSDDSYLELPAFWALHLNGALRDLRLVHGTLTEPAQLKSIYEQIIRSEQWPYFSVAWRAGRFFIVYRGDPYYDTGVDYVLEDLAGVRSRIICRLGEDAAGPCLSWSELTAVAADGADVGTQSWARRFLLLLPIVGDVASAGEHLIVARALSLVGASGELDGLGQWRWSALGCRRMDGHPRRRRGLRRPHEPAKS